MQRKFLVYAPDPPPEGGGASEQPTETPALAPQPAPAAPPAAAAVINGKTESEVNLEKQLEEERNARKKAETDAAHLQDENFRLKQSQAEPAPEKKGDGWHMPGEEDW